MTGRPSRRLHGHKVLVDRAPTQFSIGDVVWAKSTLRNEFTQFGRPKGTLVGGDVARSSRRLKDSG